MSLKNLLANPPDLPVVAGLSKLGTEGNLVVTAPPGSGKTTLIPPALAESSRGKVLVVQPRRIAARAAAYRISSLAGEPVGKSVGFRVRGETVPGARIELITPGVMLRILQADQELAGVSAVVVDEVHERDLDTDLALAFLLDIQQTLRPDLRIIAMSATVAAERTAQLLGARVLEVPGELFPVEVNDAVGPLALGANRSGRIVVQYDFLDHVAQVVRAAERHDGSILVFLPGVREIAELAGRLGGAGRGAGERPVVQLHGQLSPREQDRVLTPAEPRIILSTSIAESSLTVPGVRIVVDSGLAREPRYDPATQIGGLVTVHANRARMTQRSGRAGREGPGIAYRCLSFARAAEYGEPEIHTADLTDAMLQASVWGAPGMDGLQLFDAPKPPARDSAMRTLHSLGAVDDDGRATRLGEELARIPAAPELGRALLASTQVNVDTAAGVVALLNSAIRISGADLPRALRDVSRGGRGAGGAGGRGAAREWEREKRRLAELARPARAALAQGAAGRLAGAGSRTRNLAGDDAVAYVVALARPQWLARKRGGGYLLANGTGAVLPEDSPLRGEEWLAVADLGRAQGQADSLIYAAAPIAEEDALEAGEHLLTERTEITAGQRIKAHRITELGAIELTRNPVKVTAAMGRQARRNQVKSDGVDSLDWSESATQLRIRLAFLHEALGDPWPAMDDAALTDRADEWLDYSELRVSASSLRNLLPWPEAANLDELAPERITTPMGSAKVDYSSGRPVARLRLQECFGWRKTPQLAGIPVTLELLSPAQRPLAITDDLASFWAGPYKDVRADMRGRYPRHPWPEDPLTAEPTRRAKKKR